MKVIIDIPKEVLEHPHNYCCYALANQIKGNYTPIPDNATNGDMIKAMFPKAEFNNAMPFTDGRWETINLDTENRLRAIYKPTQLRTYADWWNAPYKKEAE